MAGRRVYFIQQGFDGPIKIGSADDPEFRLAQLQTGNPQELYLLASRPGTVQAERFLHAQYAEWRIRGEWFSPDAAGLAQEISDATQLETWELTHGLCATCGVQPVQPPRARFCSDECARQHALTRSRDWRRDKKRAAF